MTDDFSNLETGASCYVVNSSTSIYSYKNSVRKTYTLLGGKWFNTAQSTYTNIPSNTVCWSYSDITGINSNSSYEPFYLFIALFLALIVWVLWFWLFRRLFKWYIR